MRRAVAGLVVFLLLLSPLVAGANSTATTSGLKIAIVEEPKYIDVVISDEKFAELVGNNCGNYTDYVAQKVFGNNPVGIDVENAVCHVTPGGVVYMFPIKKDFMIVENGTLIQSPIPLAGKFAIKVLQSVKAGENGTTYLYVYQGPTEFIGDHTPQVIYKRVLISDPTKTLYVLVSDNDNVFLVVKEGFPLDVIEAKGMKKVEQNGYVYLVGKPTSIEITKAGIRVYFIFDGDCFTVSKDKDKNELIVQKLKSDCTGAPSPVTRYYDTTSKTKITFIYVPPRDIKVQLIALAVLAVISLGLAVYIRKNVEIKRE